MWQDPRFEAARDPAGAAARLLRPRPRAATSAATTSGCSNAQRRGADVLLTINHHSRVADAAADARRSTAATVRILRKRYPWVTHDGRRGTRPTTTRSRRTTARGARRSTTTSCARSAAAARIVAADVLDGQNMLPWLATFKRYAKRRASGACTTTATPTTSARCARPRTRQLLRGRQGRGLADRGRRDRPLRHRATAAARAARRARRAPSSARSRSRASSRRIKRVYLYHWDADPKFLTWDSAFVAAERPRAAGARRPAPASSTAAPEQRPAAGASRCAGIPTTHAAALRSATERERPAGGGPFGTAQELRAG